MDCWRIRHRAPTRGGRGSRSTVCSRSRAPAPWSLERWSKVRCGSAMSWWWPPAGAACGSAACSSTTARWSWLSRAPGPLSTWWAPTRTSCAAVTCWRLPACSSPPVASTPGCGCCRTRRAHCGTARISCSTPAPPRCRRARSSWSRMPSSQALKDGCSSGWRSRWRPRTGTGSCCACRRPRSRWRAVASPTWQRAGIRATTPRSPARWSGGSPATCCRKSCASTRVGSPRARC